jgi:hypothetical protein
MFDYLVITLKVQESVDNLFIIFIMYFKKEYKDM